MTTEPTVAELTPARAEQHRIGAAIRTSTLPPPARLLLWTAADLAAAAADRGEKFSISIVEMSEHTGMHVGQVGKLMSQLFTLGWMARTEAGQWLPAVPAVPAPRTGS